MATPPPDLTWHARPAGDLFSVLETSPEGLSSGEAEKRLQQTGPNVLSRIRSESIFSIVLRQLRNPLIYVLLAATALAIGMGKITDGMVVLGVVVINTIIGVVQEYQAGQAIEGLLRMIPDSVTVWRDGNQKSIPSAQLVPGDYVLLQAGDRVSADLRLTSAKNLQCDESALTGESLPVAKHTEPVPPEAGVGDRKCMAFSGTMVTTGAGSGVVVATGKATELGKISQLLETTQSLETPLTRSIEKIARWITLLILVVGLLIFGISLFRGYTLLDATFSAISLAVAAIPEGLPAVITIASSFGVQRMAKRRAIIRHLPAVETLGSTTVICSDKTGTLTRNEMTVQALWNTRQLFELSGIGVDPEGKITGAGNGTARGEEVADLLLAGALCNDASLEEEGTGNWQAVGDPTEVALVVAAEKSGLDEKQARQQWPRLDTVPFDSERKIMATLHESPSGEKYIYLKGAPESVIPLTGPPLQPGSDNGTAQAQGNVQQEAREKALQFANAGMRILAFARKKTPAHQQAIAGEDLENGFELLGLQAMIDPPRIEVKRAIQSCQQAGITVKMITGDHPGTAAAIGQELGIIRPGDRVLTGRELESMREETLREEVQHTHIFARVAPEHKLRLVQALQAGGNVVAMTGDGVNDAPALKRADIGVAMGITGTAVSKEAADMILTDDNFESIEAAVEEGRRVYDNLLKSIAFILPTSIGLGLVIVIAVLFFPAEDGVLLRPMQPVQVLWINLITAVALALPLALEAMEPDVMRRPPRKPGEPVLSRFLFFRMIVVALIMAVGTVGLFLWEYRAELSRGLNARLALAEAQTMAVTAMVLFQVFYLLNCRSLKYSIRDIGFFSNPAIFLGILAVLLAQLAFVYLPFMNKWFNAAPLKADAWAASALVAFSIVPVIALEKWIRTRK